MKHFIFVLILLLSIGSVAAQSPAPVGFRKTCPETPLPTSPRSMEELAPTLRANNIEILDGNTVNSANVERFLTEYNKMPQQFRSELITGGARIRIMEGSGVGIDPSLTATHTVEGKREWINVPGGGGLITENFNIPTRLAINHLYHNHGASNLVLHEHAHTLDSLYGEHALSSSPTWSRLMDNSPRAREFLNVLCSEQYCTPDKPVEAFAELFSYYYACEDTRSHMEAIVPEIADFFRNFNSARDMLDGKLERSVAGAAEDPTNEDCDTSPTSDFDKTVKDIGAVTNKLTERYSPTLPAGSTGVSASGLK